MTNPWITQFPLKKFLTAVGFLVTGIVGFSYAVSLSSLYFSSMIINTVIGLFFGKFVAMGLYLQVLKLANIWPMQDSTASLNPKVLFEDFKQALHLFDLEIINYIADVIDAKINAAVDEKLAEQPQEPLSFWHKFTHYSSPLIKGALNWAEKYTTKGLIKAGIGEGIHAVHFGISNRSELGQLEPEARIAALETETVKYTILHGYYLATQGGGFIGTTVASLRLELQGASQEPLKRPANVI